MPNPGKRSDPPAEEKAAKHPAKKNKKKAAIISNSYRQLKPKAKYWKAESIAAELAEHILKGENDSRLKWYDEEKTRVKILTPSIIPDYHAGSSATISGRRSRLFKAMRKIMSVDGWNRNKNIWEKSGGKND